MSTVTARFAVYGNSPAVPGKPWLVFDLERQHVAWANDPDPVISTHMSGCGCGCDNHGPLAYFASEADAHEWVSTWTAKADEATPSPEWRVTPTDPPVREFARMLLRAGGFEVPEELSEPGGVAPLVPSHTGELYVKPLDGAA